MLLTLDPTIKSLNIKNQFDYFMQLRGEIFRELEGRRTQRVRIGGQSYFLKQHFGIGWKEIFKNLLQLRLPIISAKNEWRALGFLKKINIPTMEIAAYGRQGWNPAEQQSFILTHESTNIISLEDVIKKPIPVPLKWKLIKKVAEIAQQIHRHGLNHRDFYLCHFMLDLNSIHHQEPKLYLIDLHRAQLRKRTPLRWILKDLAGLYFSSMDAGLTRRDLLRFIRVYRNPSALNEIEFWKRVQKRGHKTYRQHGSS